MMKIAALLVVATHGQSMVSGTAVNWSEYDTPRAMKDMGNHRYHLETDVFTKPTIGEQVAEHLKSVKETTPEGATKHYDPESQKLFDKLQETAYKTNHDYNIMYLASQLQLDHQHPSVLRL